MKNLSAMLAGYLTKAEKQRDPYRLFISDIGKCTRMTGYRLLGWTKDYVSEQSVMNKTIMFYIAEAIEYQLWRSLCREKLGIAYQRDVDTGRENWGGRFDIIADYDGGPRIIEVKTLNPNAFRHGFEYYDHQMQAKAYHHFCEKEYGLSEHPMLVYFDRGGSNTAQEKVLQPDPTAIEEYMDVLDGVRDDIRAFGADALPKRIGKVLKVRLAGKEIREEPHKDCAYCDYKSSCIPDERKVLWASRASKDSMWVATRNADPQRLAEFADKLLEEATA